jgi:2-(1,2-epoxy-1,2-dihydrophenyl)acetyl-CoA isomerase
MYTADKMSAQQANEYGLVNKLSSSEEVLKDAIAFAEKLAKGPTMAYALTKRALNKAIFDDLEELLEYEAQLQEIAGKSDDFQEGVKAFIEKREPAYTGK